MDRARRQQLRELAARISGWADLAREALDHRRRVADAAGAAVAHYRDRLVDVPLDGRTTWQVLALGEPDETRLAELARHRALAHPGHPAQLTRLQRDVPGLVDQLHAVTGLRRFFSGRRARERALGAGADLERFHDDVNRGSLLGNLLDIRDDADRGLPPVRVPEALGAAVGLADRVAPGWTNAQLLPVGVLRGVACAVSMMLIALHTELEFRDAARHAGEEMRLAEARAVLAQMPVERLRDATRARISVGALRQSGITTVRDVFERLDSLEAVPFVGPVTATRVAAAATTIWRTIHESTPLHIDVIARSAATTEFLARLALWGQVRTMRDPTTQLARTSAIHDVLSSITPDTSHLAVLCLAGQTVADFGTELADIIQRAPHVRVPPVPAMPDDPWVDFLERPAHYYALASELGFLAEHGGRIHGDVPSDVVDAIRVLELNTEYLDASLRGYQDFAAKFAIVQERVVIGDEMGLGKTVEALAALAHLRAQGHTHFLVICPAGVVTNWLREVDAHTQLPAHRLHGADRAVSHTAWMRDGGVAVTSFGTLGWTMRHGLPLEALGCVVVDEAHYVKNPEARRSQRTAEILAAVPRAILMTGTPLLNRLDEFRALIHLTRPDLLAGLPEVATAHAFRQLVAPVYLRRNQEDVLTELPDLVEVDDWVPMSAADQTAYREAVEAGNFMAMRRAAATQGVASSKLKRLVQIVEEAEDNGRRVIVFSHFRDVLAQVADLLPGPVFGPLTGSVPPAQRQLVIDEFSAASGGAALVSQIVAGGVGLNIQAASVVVICEPQLTPTTEWQAIARAHRMGQLESVQVHRLLSDEGVDARITEILAGKRAVFDDYARTSALAESAPEAFDITEAALARAVVAAERDRLLGIPGQH